MVLLMAHYPSGFPFVMEEVLAALHSLFLLLWRLHFKGKLQKEQEVGCHCSSSRENPEVMLCDTMSHAFVTSLQCIEPLSTHLLKTTVMTCMKSFTSITGVMKVRRKVILSR